MESAGSGRAGPVVVTADNDVSVVFLSVSYFIVSQGTLDSGDRSCDTSFSLRL